MTNNTIGKWEGEYGDPGPCYRCNMWPCKNRYNCKDGPLMEKPQEPKEYTAKDAAKDMDRLYGEPKKIEKLKLVNEGTEGNEDLITGRMVGMAINKIIKKQFEIIDKLNEK